MSTIIAALGYLLLALGILAVGYFLFIGIGEAILKLVDVIKKARKPKPTPTRTTVSCPVPPHDPRVVALEEAAERQLRLNLMAQQAYDDMAQKSREFPPL